METICETTVKPAFGSDIDPYVVYSLDWEEAEKKAAMVAGKVEDGAEIESSAVDLFDYVYEDLYRGMGRGDFSEDEAREFISDMTPEEYVESLIDCMAYSVLDKRFHVDEETTREVLEQLHKAVVDACEAFIELGRENDRENEDC